MGFIKPNFKDLTMKGQFMECHIGLAKFNGRFGLAQKWLDTAVAEKMYPVMPYKTGALMNQTKNINDIFAGSGLIRTYGLHYGKKLYSGINQKTGRPYHWTNPLTQQMWGTYAYMNFEPEFNKGVKYILLRGKTPDGR